MSFKSVEDNDRAWAQKMPTTLLEEMADALKVRQYVEFKGIAGDYIPESSRELLFKAIEDELERRQDPRIGCCGVPIGDC